MNDEDVKKNAKRLAGLCVPDLESLTSAIYKAYEEGYYHGVASVIEAAHDVAKTLPIKEVVKEQPSTTKTPFDGKW